MERKANEKADHEDQDDEPSHLYILCSNKGDKSENRNPEIHNIQS